MLRCEIVDFLFKAFPLKVWQDFLIRRHIQKCPVCQAGLASAGEVRPFLIQEDEVGGEENFWLRIKTGLQKEKRRGRRFLQPRPRWVWMMRIAGLIAAVVLGVWLYSVFSSPERPAEEKEEARFKINYIRVENKPAQAYVYWPQGKNMIIVWAEKNM
ncbi:MAG: hypothetical protein ACE5L7_09235 [Candidatus Aminicenantales bacterium]